MHYYRETENESDVSDESAPRRKQKSPSGKKTLGGKRSADVEGRNPSLISQSILVS